MSALRTGGTSRRPGSQNEILRGVSRRRHEGNQAETRLEEASIVRVSYAGQHRVFDIETKRYRTFFAGGIAVHNCQDFDPALFPIIAETLSASPWKLKQFTGTPKTLDGPLEKLWLDSSMAEWVTRCEACKHQNIPSLDHDLDKMIGPEIVTREISERYPGVVCAKCSRPVYPRTGRWVHRNPELRYEFAGYHVPQIIMPMHYADPAAWAILLGKRQGANNTPINVFYNEVCGESYDTGAKLVSLTELKAAAVLHENDYAKALATLGNYKRRVLAVDWGGGGDDWVSFTTAAVLGMLPSGKIDVIFGWRSLSPHDHFGEAKRLIKLLVDFRCSHLVHDYTGAGNLRETIITAAGVPASRLIPVSYIRAAAGPLMRWYPENPNTGQRSHHRLDKARSLTLTCNLIRKLWLRFFAYDYKGSGQAGLLHDFLALVEDEVDSRTGSNIYTIIRNERVGPDDFAQAVNIGVCALYYQEGRWPDLAEIEKLSLTTEQLDALNPVGHINWDAMS